MTEDTIMVSKSTMAYIILDEVEFLQDGHAAQQRPQAADPQQQAKAPMDMMQPMVFLERSELV